MQVYRMELLGNYILDKCYQESYVFMNKISYYKIMI